MSKAFTSSTMFRQVSPLQLQAFFQTFGIKVSFEIKAKRTAPRRVQDLKPFLAAYDSLPESVRSAIDEQIARIAKLATVTGIEILTQLVTQYKYEHWLIIFHKGDTHYHKVLDIWLNRREMFDQAFEMLNTPILQEAQE